MPQHPLPAPHLPCGAQKMPLDLAAGLPPARELPIKGTGEARGSLPSTCALSLISKCAPSPWSQVGRGLGEISRGFFEKPCSPQRPFSPPRM